MDTWLNMARCGMYGAFYTAWIPDNTIFFYFYQSFIRLITSNKMQHRTESNTLYDDQRKTVSWVTATNACRRGNSDNCGNFPEVFVIVSKSSAKRPRRNTLINTLCIVQICGQIIAKRRDLNRAFRRCGSYMPGNFKGSMCYSQFSIRFIRYTHFAP